MIGVSYIKQAKQFVSLTFVSYFHLNDHQIKFICLE